MHCWGLTWQTWSATRQPRSVDLHLGCSAATQNRRQIPLKGCYVSWGFPGFALPLSGIPVPPRSDQQTFGRPPKHANRRKVDFSGREAAWPSGQRVGLAIRRSRVQVPLWLLAGFVFGRPEFKSSAMLVNSQLVASYQSTSFPGFSTTLLCCI